MESVEEIAGGGFAGSIDGRGLDAAPGSDKFVVGAGVFGLALTLAQGIKSVSQLPDRIDLAAQTGKQGAGSTFAC